MAVMNELMKKAVVVGLTMETMMVTAKTNPYRQPDNNKSPEK